MEFGMLIYDVPLTRRKVYNRLRDKISRISIQLNWSCYLIPWECRDRALTVLKELDEAEDTGARILYDCIKFDSGEKGHLDDVAKREFERHLKHVKDLLDQKLGEAEVQLASEEIQLEDWALLRRDACSKAMKKITDARKLSIVFEKTSIMEAAFCAFEKLIETKREAIKDELKKAKVTTETKKEVEATVA